MSSSTYQVPALFRKALSRLPAWPGSVLFSGALNALVARHVPADTFALLDGRALCIDVKDAGIGFDFVCRGRTFVPARRQDDVALTIRASAYDFFQLAQRKEDPDTLFFSRRLTMEGDTELGLLVKNSLDAMELPVLSLDRLVPERLFRRADASK
jgi:predicted lipid carrier protein YhbT